MSRTNLFSRRVELGHRAAISSFIADAGQPDLIAFSGGFPDPVTFDLPMLRELASDLFTDPAAVQYGATVGNDGLRDWLGGWLERQDGGAVAPAELMITSGGMEGLTLLNRCLIDSGDQVLVEAPTFMGALAAIRHAEGGITAVGMDEDGLDVDELSRLLAGGARYKYLYVIPDFQNPTGRSLVAERRHRLVELARRYGLLIVEDVAYRELGFDDVRLPSLRTLGPDVTVQLGTFAKTFLPGLRLGWIAGPADIVGQTAWAKQYTDQCASPFGQRLLEEFGRSGAFDRGLVAKRAFYRERCQAMQSALAERLPGGIAYTHPAGGFFTWLTLPGQVDADEVAALLAAEAVALLAGRDFYPDGRGSHELRLAFSKVSPDQIVDGVSRLGRVLESVI